MTKRYTLGHQIASINDLYCILSDGVETKAAATKVAIENISDACEIQRGRFMDGTFNGGWFNGGTYYGGDFHDGKFHTGSFYAGVFYNAYTHGGEYYGGEYRGGEYGVGEYYGGLFEPDYIPKTVTCGIAEYYQ